MLVVRVFCGCFVTYYRASRAHVHVHARAHGRAPHSPTATRCPGRSGSPLRGPRAPLPKMTKKSPAALQLQLWGPPALGRHSRSRVAVSSSLSVVALVLFAHLLEAHQELLLFLPFVLVRSLLLWLLGVALLLLLVRLLIVFLLWLLLTVPGLLNQLLGLLGQLAIDVSNTDDRVTKYFEASCDSRLP